jgi:hypothetical protein
VKQGGTSVVSYNASGVDTTCTITGPGAPGSVAANACVVSPASFTTAPITTQTTYTITCGSVTDTVVINVVPDFEEF